MSKHTFYFLIISLFAFCLVAGVMGMHFSYNNKEISIRNQAEAQRGKVEAMFDMMWKTISQQAQVSTEYKDAFKEIYPEIIDGRYSKGDGSFMKWIQEANPHFDTSLYKALMETIESERKAFLNAQNRMIDIIREHKTLCESFPSKWFIINTTPIEYTIISSTKAKSSIESGIDDDIELFSKDN